MVPQTPLEPFYLGRIAFATTTRRSRSVLERELCRSLSQAAAEAYDGPRLPQSRIVVEAVKPEPKEGMGTAPDGLGWAFAVYVMVPPEAMQFWDVVAATAIGTLIAHGGRRLLDAMLGKAFGGDDSSIDLSTVSVSPRPAGQSRSEQRRGKRRHKAARPRKRRRPSRGGA